MGALLGPRARHVDRIEWHRIECYLILWWCSATAASRVPLLCAGGGDAEGRGGLQQLVAVCVAVYVAQWLGGDGGQAGSARRAGDEGVREGGGTPLRVRPPGRATVFNCNYKPPCNIALHIWERLC